MNKPSLDLDDFIIASNAVKADHNAGGANARSIEGLAEEGSAPSVEAPILAKLSQSVRQQKATTRAIAGEGARLALKNLKRAKERDAKFYVNVALNHETKMRLKTAAHENDVKMTVIMQAAIDFYLKENGY
ncbi:hypothetical protein WGT02_08400 [Rhizobium sp. T1470]|uniref:hypothetical protein n=1 Tax=unclassified Rhizobium TaxID=2613769 RepID=UPI001CD6327F|nr:hypothetical protein [Rhizobium sp. T1473]MCA0801299.1 hypothetical protein [Rhizobium sp. T1473]